MSLVALPSAATQANQVFDNLRGEILSCRIAPGAKIRINEIAARLDVSLGSVREALSRLSAEGMVIAQAQKGYTVAPVSEEELVDLTNTRISIEQLCLRNAIERGDVEWETGIVAAFHRLHRIPERDPSDPAILNEKWSVAHGAFHLALVAGCNSQSLLRIRANLYAQTERYRRLSVPLRREERDVDAEHKALMEGVLGRNADLACGLISDHLWRTTRILLASPILTVVESEDS
jgi:GntR family carbon starvation induced transcriptional regulator